MPNTATQPALLIPGVEVAAGPVCHTVAGTVEQSSRQEQWALPEPVQHGQQAAQQQILDTYLG